ncbi:MAG: ABC transporter substrate-binding protein, partial [Leptolyngbya sp. SIO1D8]|nr:ABC transporter substrate-binding protein [Leptolyngbya sp. SIO1D8]
MFFQRAFLRFKQTFSLGLITGLSLALLWGCLGSEMPANLSSMPAIDSPEQAETVLLETLLPNIETEEMFVSDEVASRYNTDNIIEPLPNVEDFPLHAATPSNNPNTLYLEIYSSSEKANVDKQNERWLVEVAEAFNQQALTTASGQTIQVGIRQIPSGTAARLLAAGTLQPAGYSPSNDLWIELLKSQEVSITPVEESLVLNTAGFVLQADAYTALGSDVSFEQIVDAMLSGQLTAGYPNPYTSSTSLNLLYHLFW